MADNAPLFRKVATDQLSSPDELDRALRVTGPHTWLAVGAFVVMVALLFAWSFVGSVPSQVRGEGILLHPGGVSPVVSTTSGRVTELAVQAGDLVRRGQPLATIVQLEMAAQLTEARADIEAARRQQDDLAQFHALDAQQQLAVFRAQRDDATRTLTEALEQARWYDERVRAEEALLAQRLLPDDKRFETRRSALAERARAEAARTKLREIELNEGAWRNRIARERLEARLRVEKAERGAAAVTARLRDASAVVSPSDGRVIDVLVVNGQMAAAGEPLLRLEPASEALEALLYLPAKDGKKVKPGMTVRVAPSTVKPEEFGYVQGVVRSVSAFPASAKGMQRLLQHEGLVTTLSASGTPFEVLVTLSPDPTTASGYRWTSGRGPDLQLMSGTLATALVTERTRRPIELVLPFVRSLFAP
jgi:HlyD family secretion protein